MSRPHHVPLVLLALALLALPTLAAAQNGSRGPRQPQQPGTTLTAAEKADLLYMTREEKLARDVYAALHARHPHRVFAHIGQAEQRHLDAMLALVQRYGLPDPVAGLPAGQFGDPVMDALYVELVAAGNVSLEAALRVGVRIERADIADLQDALDRTRKPDIRRVYGHLLAGSRNHLAAFTRVLASLP